MKKKALKKLYIRLGKVAHKGLLFLQKTIAQSILISVVVFISSSIDDRFYLDIKVYQLVDEAWILKEDALVESGTTHGGRGINDGNSTKIGYLRWL